MPEQHPPLTRVKSDPVRHSYLSDEDLRELANNTRYQQALIDAQKLTIKRRAEQQWDEEAYAERWYQRIKLFSYSLGWIFGGGACFIAVVVILHTILSRIL